MRYRAVLDAVQPHVVQFAAFIPLIAAALSAAANARQGSANRRAQAASDIADLQASGGSKPQFEPSAESAKSILPELPQGTKLRDAMGYDANRRTGGAEDYSEAAMSTEMPMSQPSQAPPPQIPGGSYNPKYPIGGTQASADYTLPKQGGGGLSADQYVQLAQLGMQASQMFRGPGASPMPQPSQGPQYQPTTYELMRRRRF